MPPILAPEEVKKLLDWGKEQHQQLLKAVDALCPQSRERGDLKRRITQSHNRIERFLSPHSTHRMTRNDSFSQEIVGTIENLRPVTSHGSRVLREGFLDTLQQFSDRGISKPVQNAILQITQEQAQSLIDEYCRETRSGCRISRLTASERYSYVNLNRSTYRRSDGSRFPDGKYYLHHIAILLKRRSRTLLRSVYATSGTSSKDMLQVSHLCHRSHCLNPDHLVVEPMDDNLNRNRCQHQQIIDYNPGVGQRVILHPCPHRATTRLKTECILPTVVVHEATAPFLYYNEPGFNPH